MESLPEGSVVVCMGGTVRYMTERESVFPLAWSLFDIQISCKLARFGCIAITDGVATSSGSVSCFLHVSEVADGSYGFLLLDRVRRARFYSHPRCVHPPVDLVH